MQRTPLYLAAIILLGALVLLMPRGSLASLPKEEAKSPAVAPPAASAPAKAPETPAPASAHPNAKQWPISAGGNGHYYEPVAAPDGVNWTNAQKYALLEGGYLATCNTEAENKFVFSLIDDPKYWRNSSSGGYGMGPWIGAFKTDDGQWQWINHEGPIAFAGWARGQPDNSNKIQDRAHFYSWQQGGHEPTWDDVEKTNPQKGFVIEYDTDPAKLPENPDAALNYTEPVGVPPAVPAPPPKNQ